MKSSRFILSVTSTLVFAALGLAATQAQAGGIFIQPEIVIGVPGVVVAQPVVEYAPNPFDVYITNVGPADVVYLHGDTFIWGIDGNGRRYQRFYAHGDRRADVFRRRDELHRVMARNGGHLPNHEMARHEGENGRDQHHEQDRRDDHHEQDRRDDHHENHDADHGDRR